MKRVKYKDIEQIPKMRVAKAFKQEFFGSSPAPFIGRVGYPNINIGVLSPQFSGDTSYYDNPGLWSKGKFSVNQVANLRYGLVNSRTKGNVYQPQGKRFQEICQEVGIAAKPVEMEVSLQKAPQLQEKGDKVVTPWGPASSIKRARVTSNSRVDTRVDRVVSDTDLKANPALTSLYKKGFDTNQLHKILSVGSIGIEKNRKLVPTRWSITAVDDTVGKDHLKQIRTFPEGDMKVYFGGDWGNYYVIMMFPAQWSYELFEVYVNKDSNPWSKQGLMYSTDHERFNGRKKYAEETAGGYYACRLPILDHLKTQKRQQTCVALRFITDEYAQPLGVWVCREATRKSLASKPVHFDDEALMRKYVYSLVQTKFGIDARQLLRKSKVLTERQKQLRNFI